MIHTPYICYSSSAQLAVARSSGCRDGPICVWACVCVCMQLVFVPDMFLHAIVNLEESVAAAIQCVSAVQCSVVQCSVVLCSGVQCSAVQCSVV